ncbi:MAG: hypothetical protein H6811_06645 [Phycisphaeraceae bacterium]|nr:hypothetical protein [Phycisphaeraceae bacterium]
MRRRVWCQFDGLRVRRLVALRRMALGMVSLMLVVFSPGFSSPGAPRQPAEEGPSTGRGTAPSASRASDVVIITLRTGDEPIGSITARSFIRRLRLAERAGADAFVVEIDTPGGEVGAILDICDAIKDSSIKNSIAWINTKAYSGGAIIALACSKMIANDPATVGDAMPIAVSFGQLNALPPEERAKLMVPLVAEVWDSAGRHNLDSYTYDENLLWGIVTTGLELWYVENTQTGQRLAVTEREYRTLMGEAPPDLRPRLAPGSASSRGGSSGLQQQPALTELRQEASQQQEYTSDRPVISQDQRGQWRLIEKISDGSAPFVFKADDLKHYGLLANDAPIGTDEALISWLGAQHVKRLDPLWSEGLVQVMTSLPVRGILMVLFLLGVFIEMVHPGLFVPGTVASIALFALILPPFLMGLANWWEILAIIGGILLILLEIFVIPGFGVPGVLGLLLLFFGLLGTFIPDQGSGLFPDSPEERRDLLFGVMTLVIATTTALVGMWLISRHFGTIPILRRLVLSDDNDEGGADMLTAMAPAVSAPVRVGQEGVSLTPLRPVGRAEFGEAAIDVKSESGYISARRRVRVVEVGKFDVLVAEVEDQDQGEA